MSATNSTLNYQLPQFIATDKPAWLVDFNGAMSDIDTAIKEAKTAGDNAQSTANTNATNIATLDGTVTSQGTAIGTLTTSVAGNTGSIHTINSLIGNGEPTTTDKTIIGAINEINSKVGDVDADDVSFDNTNTGLSATDVQAAIVEVKGLIPSGPGSVDADDVSYDNTDSGLVATNVQDAIDELASASPSGGADLNFVTAGSFTVTASALFTPQADDRSVVKYLVNTDKTIGKVYGSLFGSVSSSATTNTWVDIATLTAAGVLPTITEAYNVEIGGAIFYSGNSTKGFSMRLHFNTDGTVTLQAYSGSWADATYVMFSLPPCIYVLQNLGD